MSDLVGHREDRFSHNEAHLSLFRLRREGDKIFKSKYMLLTVVILCILDCALVLGELTLDLHKVKGIEPHFEILSFRFIFMNNF